MISREQLKMARAALGWNVIATAKQAGVSPNTVTRYENGTDAYGGTLLKLRRAFEKAGLAFIDGNGEGPGVRFKKPIADDRKHRARRSDLLRKEANSRGAAEQRQTLTPENVLAETKHLKLRTPAESAAITRRNRNAR